jgi:hypothetical protein
MAFRGYHPRLTALAPSTSPIWSAAPEAVLQARRELRVAWCGRTLLTGNIVAPACDCLADQHFRISVRIHLGGVDQVHPGAGTTPQRGNLRPTACRVLGQVPGALAEDQDLVPRAT